MASTFFKPASRSSAALAAVVLALVFIVPSWMLISTGYESGRGSFDQNAYHLKAIERFSAQWPRFDFSNYESATTPGYHLALAAVHRFYASDLSTLRYAGSLFTVAMLLTLGWVLARRLGVAPALAAGAPIAASLYTFSAGTWLLPDNAAWLCIVGLLLVVLRTRFDLRMLVVSGALLAALALTRQIHLWAASLVWLAAWLGTGPNAGLLSPMDAGNRFRRTGLAVLATLPAFAIVGCFVYLWGGPVPPMFQAGTTDPDGHIVTGANFATPALILALIGLFGTFYAALLWPAHHAGMFASRRARLALAGSIGIAVLIAAIPESTFNEDAGRWSGLWNIVARFDAHGAVYADRSPFIILLAGLGGAWLALWGIALNARDRWLFIAAWIAFAAAQMTSHFSWQRYYEPFILIMFAIFAMRLPGTGAGGWAHSMTPPKWASRAWAGPVALALLLAAITVLSLR